MPRSFAPAVSPQIHALREDYRALSVTAEGVINAASHPASDRIVEGIGAGAPWPAWGDDHLEAWRDAYRRFGAKPQRTPSSVEALAKRVQGSGQLPAINAVVDLYNALSVRFVVPIGGEDITAYVGSPKLHRAAGGELFDTLKEGIPCQEAVPAGEVVWSDERGVTCRRWNWRQGLRTRIGLETTRMWFVLERLEPMPMAVLLEAGDLLAATLKAMSPEAHITCALLPAPGDDPST